MEQIGVGQRATKVNQRIIFVEPNDVFDKDANNAQQGLSLTPKYEDFCISFNLIIEAFSRFKTSGSSVDKNGQKDENGNVKKYSIEWGMTKDEMIKRRTSVLQGNRGKDTLNDVDGSFAYSESDYNYLTTYYTDLTFDSYKEKTQIEGLGVESVQISYESWYTPTVTIKFIDVRGSALFGREEAVHVDEKLTAENVFGAFFTMPYPLFRLQVKGFLGKPVTYQLTCSNFKGEFNSQTGNFEAVATFIGYSWSLLTDIPFTYLVAAPNCSYVGKDYWERHKSTKDWGLWDGGNTTIEPPKLTVLFELIKNADQQIDKMVSIANSEQNERLQGINNEQKILNELTTNLNGFINELKAVVDSKVLGPFYDETEKKQQLLLFSDSKNLKPSNDAIKKYEDMYASLQQYTTSYSGKEITTDKAPNKWNACPRDISFIDRFNVNANSSGVVQSIKVKDLTTLTIDGLKSLVFNDKGGKLTHKTAENLYNAINNSSKSSSVRQFVYLVDLYDISTLISDRLRSMGVEQEGIVKEVNDQINYNIKSILGFKPFIGNVFKIVFCHLETFCHIMFDSADEIYTQMKSGERSPSFLNISSIESDIVKGVNENVTPWPAIYDNGFKTEECGYVSETANVYGWVGDFSHNFIEEKVVYALQEGIQQIVDNLTNERQEVKTSEFPTSAYDYVNNGSVFSMVGESNISDLSGYLSIRAAQNIGVMAGNNISVNMATLMGKMDAYNFYSTNSNVSSIKTILEDKTVKDIKGISYCDQNYDKWAYGQVEGTDTKYHLFETVKKIREDYNDKGRKPMFKAVNGSNLFVHWYDDKQISYVPSSLQNFKNYSEDFEYESNNGNNPYFKPKTHERTDEQILSYDWLYNSDSTKITVLNDKHKQYVNKFMFNIIDDDKRVSAIVQKHDQMKTGGCKVHEYEVKDDFNEYVNMFLKVGKEYKTKFFKNITHMLSGSRQKLGVDESNFLSDDLYGKSKTSYNFTFNGWDLKQNSNLKNEVCYNDSGNLTLNGQDVTINDLVIQQLKVIHFGTECNLFGCPFYYLQNAKRASENDETYKDRVLKVKCLLFLHTFRYDYLNTDLNVFSKSKKTGGLEVVPKAYLLFLGAMLWRKRYAAEHNSEDPIVYGSNIDTDKYTSPSINKTLFINSNGVLLLATIRKNDTTFKYTYDVKSLFGGDDNIDCNIENQLINLFEKFAKNTFSVIASKYELKNVVKNSVVKEYTSVSLKEDIAKIGEYTQKYDKGQIDSINYEIWLRNFGIDNWAGKYSAINVRRNTEIKNQGLKMLFNEKDVQTQNLFKDLYVGTYIISDATHRRLGVSKGNVQNTDQIWVDDKLYDAYLSGFLNACNDIISGNTTILSNVNNLSIPNKLIKNRDLSVAIYYYLKNVWDKWLVISETTSFDVKNFFEKNFIFTDSFYKNTYNLLAINCQKLLSAWIELADNASLFHFLSRIVSDHTCIFLPVPDYVGFNGESQKHDIEMMEDLFRPLPYNSMEAPSNNNKFVVMFTHSPSSIKDDDNGFKSDSYDIWSHTEGFTKTASELFKSTNSEDFDRNTGTATKEGYNVPSFGISFGRQNNHIFKNLKVTMDNPVMTEQAIKATWEIAKMGSGGGRKINFIGQDTFNVFSNYSYTVNVEMMGNAQICPLMYFQLMNIPMWRGTYMIFKVTHNMTPGNMITTVSAMKMSKYSKPFNSTFFVYNPYAKSEEEKGGVSNSCDGGGGSSTGSTPSIVDGTYGKAGMFTGKSEKEKQAMCHMNNFSRDLITTVTVPISGGTQTIKMNKYVVEDFKKICEEIMALGWYKLYISSHYREKNSVSGGTSRHCYGLAVDINGGRGGNPWFATRIQQNQPEPAEGSQAPWKMKKSPYNGTYHRDKCIWHWKHPVVQIFLAHGWGWGGTYGDVMHFSIDGH